MRSAGVKDTGEINQAYLLAASWKPEVGFGHGPATFAIGHLKAQSMARFMATLAHGDVHGRVGGMHPSFGDQPKRPGRRDILPEINFDVMIAGYPLILAAPKIVEIPSIEHAYEIGNILAVVIHSAGNLTGRFDGGDGQFRRRNDEPFIHEDVGSSRMVDCHQRKLIVVIGFPQFGGDAQVIEAIAWHKLVSADLVPLLRSFDARGAE